MAERQWGKEEIASGIDNEDFDYWLEQYYDRARCVVLLPDTLDAFDAARSALNKARGAAEREGLLDG